MVPAAAPRSVPSSLPGARSDAMSPWHARMRTRSSASLKNLPIAIRTAAACTSVRRVPSRPACEAPARYSRRADGRERAPHDDQEESGSRSLGLPGLPLVDEAPADRCASEGSAHLQMPELREAHAVDWDRLSASTP